MITLISASQNCDNRDNFIEPGALTEARVNDIRILIQPRKERWAERGKKKLN